MIEQPKKRGRPRISGPLPADIRYKRFVAKTLSDGGRMMMVAMSGDLCKLVAHIRRRDELRTDSDAVRAAVLYYAQEANRKRIVALKPKRQASGRG